MDKERFQISINYRGKDINVILDDIEIAQLVLNDNDYAENVINKLSADGLEEIEGPIYISSSVLESSQEQQSTEPPSPSTTNLGPSSSVECEPIWCRKKPTTTDLEASSKLLKLRQDMAGLFDDKKTVKSKLWNQIATVLQAEFNLGENGAVKCRQKFANLYRAYQAFITHQKTTGTGRNDEPPAFFDEMHSILGGKDKVNPTYLVDSMEMTTEGIQETNSDALLPLCLAPSTSSECSEETTKVDEPISSESSGLKDIKNRFKKVRQKLKPVSKVDVVVEEIRLNRESQAEQFSFLKDHLKKSEKQRERFLDIVEKAFNRKRKRTDSSDSNE